MRGKKPLGIYKGGDCAHFERDVVVSDADLQLLFADDVFLWPVRVVLPLIKKRMRIDDRGKSELIFGRSKGITLT